jgi:hypothetical protein
MINSRFTWSPLSLDTLLSLTRRRKKIKYIQAKKQQIKPFIKPGRKTPPPTHALRAYSNNKGIIF